MNESNPQVRKQAGKEEKRGREGVQQIRRHDTSTSELNREKKKAAKKRERRTRNTRRARKERGRTFVLGGVREEGNYSEFE
jgi:hypothetical protein